MEKKKKNKKEEEVIELNPQNGTEYEPTTCEKKILEVLLNPEYRNKKVTEICTIAGVDRKVYYRAFDKPEFVAYYKKISVNLTIKAVAPMVNAFVKWGLSGSFQHGKVILEMAEVYKEKQQLDINKTIPISELVDE